MRQMHGDVAPEPVKQLPVASCQLKPRTMRQMHGDVAPEPVQATGTGNWQLLPVEHDRDIICA
jgi:hypothetical protein